MEFKYDMRTTKEIVRGVVKSCSLYIPDATYKVAYPEDGTGIKDYIIYNNSIYEIKTTTKKNGIVANNKLNKDEEKQFLLDKIREILKLINFTKTYYHNGELVIEDIIKNYTVKIIKKKKEAL